VAGHARENQAIRDDGLTRPFPDLIRLVGDLIQSGRPPHPAGTGAESPPVRTSPAQSTGTTGENARKIFAGMLPAAEAGGKGPVKRKREILAIFGVGPAGQVPHCGVSLVFRKESGKIMAKVGKDLPPFAGQRRSGATGRDGRFC